MLEETKKFASETFQDLDGGYSAKRLGLFMLIGSYLFIVFGAVFGGLEASDKIIDSLVTLITWMGAYVASERLPKFINREPKP